MTLSIPTLNIMILSIIMFSITINKMRNSFYAECHGAFTTEALVTY
jgi:hypothetical protein